MKHDNRLIALLALSLPALTGIQGAIKLPDIFSDNMVLQQSSDARMWGFASPGSVVTVTPSWPGATSVSATTSSEGRWDLTLPVPAASMDTYTIAVNGDGDSIVLDNVAVGEVWFCSGQSNMEMPLRGFWTQPVEEAARTIAYSGKYGHIRVATVPKSVSYEPQDTVAGKWKVSAPENAAEFTALGYFFARSLSDILNVPVGIISCAYGGSKVEGWQPREQLDAYLEWDVDKERNDTTLQEYERINVMYNAMLHPLIGYNVKGFLWNQGESNVGRHDTYPLHQKEMVEHWREAWGLGELPFYFVELPGWDYGDPDGIDAALFREAQHEGARILPNSGIVCTSDLIYPHEINDIHASRKREIGERLAWLAATKTYGVNGLPHTYPVFRSFEREGDKLVLSFDNAWDGFTPNKELEGFEVAGEDGVFYPAQASERYSTRQIVVSSSHVEKPVAVRYNFRNFAVGRVHDLMGMPLIPFRSDKN